MENKLLVHPNSQRFGKFQKILNFEIAKMNDLPNICDKLTQSGELESLSMKIEEIFSKEYEFTKNGTKFNPELQKLFLKRENVFGLQFDDQLQHNGKIFTKNFKLIVEDLSWNNHLVDIIHGSFYGAQELTYPLNNFHRKSFCDENIAKEDCLEEKKANFDEKSNKTIDIKPVNGQIERKLAKKEGKVL